MCACVDGFSVFYDCYVCVTVSELVCVCLSVCACLMKSQKRRNVRITHKVDNHSTSLGNHKGLEKRGKGGTNWGKQFVETYV